MKNAIRAEVYLLRHNRLIWLISAVYGAVGFSAGFFDHAIFDSRQGLELFGLSESVRIIFPLMAAIMTGYMTGGPFSRHTIRNVLSAGVSKKQYYFAQLSVQMALTVVLFFLAVLIHTICRMVHPMGSGEKIELLWWKLAVYMAVVLLQILAYVAVTNGVCYFVRSPLAAMAVGMGLLYAEVILRQVCAENGLISLQHIAEYAPSGAMRGLFAYAVYDRILDLSFLRFGLSAAAIIVAGCVMGYTKFCYGTDVD